MKNNKTNRGMSIIGVLLLGLIIILALSYFGVNVKGIVESPAAQDNLHYVGGIVQNFWNKYLRDPAVFLWKDVWLEIFWKPFLSNMGKIRNSEPTDLQRSSPTVNYNESLQGPLFA